MQDNDLKMALQNWKELLKKYQKPNDKKAIIQILNSFLPFLGLWVLMYFSLNWSYLVTLALALANAFFLVRIFIIQHDCGHQSFFKSRRVNDIIGFISSFFSTIPYRYWSRMHSIHHAHNGQFEYRGLGDIHFLTTEEYRMLSKWKRLKYRIFRHPIVLFLVAPIVYLSVALRYPLVRLKGWKRIRWSHLINNLLLLVVFTVLAMLLGWKKLVLIHIPILLFFGIIAFWFFYVQHQQEENYKESKEKWDHLVASIRGSTCYKLPKLFQWLTGNIGFHHIHHLNSRIPNYHLAACAHENPLLNQFANILTIRQSLKCIRHKLWDTEQRRMISFKEYYRMASRRRH